MSTLTFLEIDMGEGGKKKVRGVLVNLTYNSYRDMRHHHFQKLTCGRGTFRQRLQYGSGSSYWFVLDFHLAYQVKEGVIDLILFDTFASRMLVELSGLSCFRGQV